MIRLTLEIYNQRNMKTGLWKPRLSAVMLLILFPSILQNISKMKYGNFVEFDLGHSSEGERVNYQLTVFLYEWLFIAASSIGITSAIGTSSGSRSNIHN